MTKRTSLHSLLAFIGLSIGLLSSTQAQRGSRLSYNYIDLGYSFADYEEFGDGSGLGLNFSKSLSKRLFLYANANWSTIDIDTVIDSPDGDAFSGTFGIGGVYPMDKTVHLVGKLGWAASSLDFGDLVDDIDGNGINFEVGIRALINADFELAGFVGFTDVGDVGNGEDIELSGIYHFKPNLGVGLLGNFSDGGDNLTAFVRWAF